MLGDGGGPSISVRMRWISVSIAVLASVSLTESDIFEVGRWRLIMLRILRASSRSLLVSRWPIRELSMAE